MRANRLKEIWASGSPAINAWLSMPSFYGAEIMAHAGFDSVTVDLQHGVHDYMSAVHALTAISTTAAVPLARLDWLDEAGIMKLLDAGAMGLICPMIETAADVARFVRAALYPPAGIRSCGPNRATLYGGPDYLEKANDEIVLLAMIETRSALDQLDAILAVPGLTGIYVGPSDLAAALGHRPQADRTDPWFIDLLADIAGRTTARGLVPAIHCGGPDYAMRMLEIGFRFVTVAQDSRLVAIGAAEAVAAMRAKGPRP